MKLSCVKGHPVLTPTISHVPTPDPSPRLMSFLAIPLTRTTMQVR